MHDETITKGAMSKSSDRQSRNRESEIFHETRRALDPQLNLERMWTLRFWKWFAVVMTPAACAIAYRAWTAYAHAPVLGGAFGAVVLTLILLHAVMSGVADTNHGVYLRKYHPIGYAINISVVVLAYGCVVLAILMANRT